ncbi:MAG: DUF1385 domain-containing protein [Dehalococcoidia bacterium]
MARNFYYGGQAIIEGVMIRGQRNLALAVRGPQGAVAVTTQPLPSLYTGRLREVPFVRGVVVLIETLVIGMRSLLYSADASLGEEVKISSWMIWTILPIGLAFAVALFFVTPLLLARLLDPLIASSLVSNLIEGFLRLGILVAYLKVIGLAPDIRRVFAYHGAEHKVVNAYEAGAPLEVAAVRRFRTAHVRCGTSFLLAVVVIAIVVFSLLGRPPLVLTILSRILLLPLIAAIGYEAIRFQARHIRNSLVRMLTGAGLALQTLTTREPDDGQIEVALMAMKGALEADQPEAEPWDWASFAPPFIG